MGSSSKKVKGSKESRKRRHRSRSHSDEETREKERHRHKKHHSHRERKHEKRDKHREYESEESSGGEKSPIQVHNVESSPERSPSPSREQKSADSLSIEETNKLRAKLGLKPLDVASKQVKSDDKKSDGKIKDDLGEFYHAPAPSLADKARQEKLRAKLAERKEKRKLESKLTKVKTLGDSDEDDDAHRWVQKNRRIQLEKQQAAKRAKMLEELDEEFGIGEIIETETQMKRAKIYRDKHLKGLKVEHSLDNIAEGKNVILTLKDSDILAEEDDVLVNVNLVDDERYKKSNENKKRKPGYQAYDDEFDEEGNFQGKKVLGKYDEEIDGEKRDSFTIGENYVQEKKRIAETVKEKLSNKRLESLVLPELQLASEYYSEAELTKFKKPKKRVKKKLREKGKILTAADLAASLPPGAEAEGHLGSRRRPRVTPGPSNKTDNLTTDWMDIDDVPEIKPQSLSDIKLEAEDRTLELALHKARRMKQRGNLVTRTAMETAPLVKEEPQLEPDTGYITLNSTAEFCRTLGDIPTYGRSGNRDQDEDLAELEGELKQSPATSPIRTNTWNNVDSADALVASSGGALVSGVGAGLEAPILDEEPDVGAGVGAALRLALSKGYLDKEENNRPSNTRLAHLQAKHYSIEDKSYGDDDKFGGGGGGNRRERHNGPTQDFKEREGFRPNVKLEYIDDEGHVLNAKEAFRYLSHKFHGKGPGKNKIEKRIKKSDQEALMKKMSSTDTPLGTLNMLQHKQKEMQSPFIVLSGSKHTHSTSISKARR